MSGQNQNAYGFSIKYDLVADNPAENVGLHRQNVDIC